MEKLFIPIILGTARKGRHSKNVAHFVLEYAKEYGFETQLIDTTDFPLNQTQESDELAAKWSAIADKADGFIIVSPEYNHSYPGELKLLLDSIYKEYNRKPLGICGVSGGSLGGARMAEQLKLVSIELQMVPIRNTVYFSKIQELFDDQGKLKDEGVYRERLKAMFDELAWYAKALRNAKEHV